MPTLAAVFLINLMPILDSICIICDARKGSITQQSPLILSITVLLCREKRSTHL